MKGLLLMVAVSCILACGNNQLSEEQKIENAKTEAQSLARKIAAPLIADEVGQLNLLIAAAGDEKLSQFRRRQAVGNIIHNYPEWLTTITLDNLSTQESQARIEKQKKFIEAKYMQQATEELYKKKLQKQQEN